MPTGSGNLMNLFQVRQEIAGPEGSYPLSKTPVMMNVDICYDPKLITRPKTSHIRIISSFLI
jgi:hypothetical protein